jgi:hypothetical protein
LIVTSQFAAREQIAEATSKVAGVKAI